MVNDRRSSFDDGDLTVMAVETAAFVPLLAGAAVCAAFLACGRPLDVAAIAGTGVACGGLALYVLMLRWMVRGL